MKSTPYRTLVPQRKKAAARLLIFSPLYPPHTGGLENHAEQFSRYLAKRGFSSTIFTPLITASPSEEKQGVNVHILRFPAWEIIPNYPVPKLWHPAFWRQLYSIWRQPHDIIISRTRFFLTSLMALVLAKLKRMPWLHIEHGSDYVYLRSPFKRTIARLYDATIGWLVFRAADIVVANSEASAAFIHRFVPGKKVPVIYRGVEIERIAAIPAAFPPSATIRVAYVGRLIDGKGVDDLLRAFALVKAPAAQLLIIGDGPMRSTLTRLAKILGIARRVTFYGDTPWEKAIGLLKGSGISVNPSYNEGLPTAVIEAALCGCAVIATDVGGTGEIITHQRNGLLFTPRNIDQLSNALSALIGNDNERRRLALQAQQDTRARFSWKVALDHYQELLV